MTGASVNSPRTLWSKMRISIRNTTIADVLSCILQTPKETLSMATRRGLQALCLAITKGQSLTVLSHTMTSSCLTSSSNGSPSSLLLKMTSCLSSDRIGRESLPGSLHLPFLMTRIHPSWTARQRRWYRDGIQTPGKSEFESASLSNFAAIFLLRQFDMEWVRFSAALWPAGVRKA